MLGLAPSMQLKVLPLGQEQQPVLVVDHFSARPDLWVQDACKQSFVANSPYYPGVRALAPEAYRQRFLHSLQSTICKVFALPSEKLSFSVCHYSLVTTAPDQLKLLQRIPHFDTTDPHALAAVHYLFQGNQGGTAFYRHRKTGFETIDESRTQLYYRSLESENSGPDIPGTDAGYIQGDTPLFCQLGAVEGCFNRLVVYRRTLLHSAQIGPDTCLSADPRQGRLTISSFIDCQP
ncbi:DUF6445 family protein [Rheinheimera sp.]|uniref:DUF6445 family protein n=1 Tax=Rheinheimera sp. TaxID=1869214 RepID=UPI00307E5E60